MTHRMINLDSVLHGLSAMTDLTTFFEYWAIHWDRQGFWLHLWTPTWHKGRGPYISLGLGWLKIYRGY